MQTEPCRSQPSHALSGRLRVPGDKSISHRSIILGAIADGVSRVRNLLEGGDIHSTIGVMRALGAEISREGPDWVVRGVGERGLQSPDGPLDCGNAGTGARLIMGAVSAYALSATFVGDESLSVRPMNRVLDPLRGMGVRADAEDGGTLPVTIQSGGALRPIQYAPPKASAQVKSAILLAGLGAKGRTSVIEAVPTRAHTETMLRAFGVAVDVEQVDGADVISVDGPVRLSACDVDVPGDPSSAGFAAVASLIVPGSEIILEGMMRNPRRDALYDALAQMGGDVSWENARTSGGEPVADLRVRHSHLRGAVIDPTRAADMIDEYPVLAVAAAFADGETVMEGIHELRVKESDRISATVALLRENGVTVQEREDGMSVTGGAGVVTGGGIVTTHHDHRIAMSALVLGLGSIEGCGVDDISPIATSYPTFFEQLRDIGATFEGAP